MGCEVRVSESGPFQSDPSSFRWGRFLINLSWHGMITFIITTVPPFPKEAPGLKWRAQLASLPACVWVCVCAYVCVFTHAMTRWDDDDAFFRDCRLIRVAQICANETSVERCTSQTQQFHAPSVQGDTDGPPAAWLTPTSPPKRKHCCHSFLVVWARLLNHSKLA